MIATIATFCFALAAAAAVVRVVRGPNLADRVIALDVALVALMCSMATHAAANDSTTYLTIVAVVAIVGFTATVSLARFIVAEGEDSNIGRPERPPTPWFGARTPLHRAESDESAPSEPEESS